MKRIVIFGNQQAAIDCAGWLLNRHDVQIIAFVGCEKPQDKQYGYPSTSFFCREKNIPFFDPSTLDNAFYELFKRWRPDLCLSIYYRRIFNERYLSVPPMGFINMHPSLLPKYRGSMPTLWALFNNEKKAGVTLHYIDRGIDTGDIIAQKIYSVPPAITGYALHRNLMGFGFHLFKKIFPLVLTGRITRIKQNHTEATYFSAYNETLRAIDWYSPSERILSRIRTLTRPYAGAVARVLNKDIIFWSARKYILSKKKLRGPGKIVKVQKNGAFVVSTIDGFILVTDNSLSETFQKKRQTCIAVGNTFIL